MKKWLNKGREFAESALETAQSVGGSLTERARNIDVSGLKETISGGVAMVTDKAGDIVDAAGNRITHPSKAFEEGVEAVIKATGNVVSAEELDIENPYK